MPVIFNEFVARRSFQEEKRTPPLPRSVDLPQELFDTPGLSGALPTPESHLLPTLGLRPCGWGRAPNPGVREMPAFLNPETVIGGEPLGVATLLGDRYLIPDYQRDYVWTRSVVRQLWRDFIAHYRRNTKDEKLIPSPKGYFLGAMVVVKQGGATEYEVIDGQQRLTTLTTLVSVLFDVVSRLPEDEHKDGLETTLKGLLGRYAGAKWEANITFASTGLADFFLQSCVTLRTADRKEQYWETPFVEKQWAPKKSPLRLVKEAMECGYDEFGTFLGEIGDPAKKRERIIAFCQLVTECVVALRITAQSHADAYAIFESLNNRGMPLTQADLIKNELLKIAAPSDKDEIVDAWVAMKQILEPLDVLSLPDFLHYSYISRHGKPKASELYTEVRKIVANSVQAKSYAEELKQDAEALDKLIHGDNLQFTAKTNDMLLDIREALGVKLSYPYLIAAYRWQTTQASGFNKKVFEDHVRLIMNFAFRFMKVLDGEVSQLVSVVHDATNLAKGGSSTIDIGKELQKAAPDSLFVERLKTVAFSNTKLAYFAVYSLESARLSGTMPLPHGKESNLEHIMPRTPSKSAWPHIASQKARDQEEFKEYLWRLGNLLPLPEEINKTIQNKAIGHKISNASGKDYTSCSLISPKEVKHYLDASEWTYKSVVDRQNDIATKFGLMAWPL